MVFGYYKNSLIEGKKKPKVKSIQQDELHTYYMPTTPETMLFTDDGFLYHTSRMNNELYSSLASKSSSNEDYHNRTTEAGNFTDFVMLG